MQANQYFNTREQLNEWSWGLYSVTLLPDDKFEYICQGYLDSEDNDWRGSYDKVDGTYKVEGNKYTLTGTKAISESRSYGYQSGVKQNDPPTYTATITGDEMKLEFHPGSSITLQRGTSKQASAAIVYSDRMFS